MTDFIYDIETYPNLFCVAIRQADTDPPARWGFDHNSIPTMAQFIQWLRFTGARMVGFNNLAFDYPVIHYILTTTPTPDPPAIYQFAQKIIKQQQTERFSAIVWDRDQIVPQVDLFKIHHFDNRARQTSLKIIQFNMRSETVQDLPFPPGTMLTDQQIAVVKQYNHHDVDETHDFYLQSIDAIRFRDELTAKYGQNFVNYNDTKIGKAYFIMELERLMPGSCYGIGHDGRRVPRQTHRSDGIRLADVILPWIKFKRPEFIQTLRWIADQTIPIEQIKGFFKKPKKKRGTDGNDADDYIQDELDPRMPPCVVNGFRFIFGTGGIHGSITDSIIYADEYTPEQRKKQNDKEMIDQRILNGDWEELPEMSDFAKRYLDYLKRKEDNNL